MKRKDHYSTCPEGMARSLACLMGRAILLICLLVFFFTRAEAGTYSVTGDLSLTISDGGRVTDLQMGTGHAIDFCIEGGSELTGGFYIREITLTQGSKLPANCTNLIVGNPDPSSFAAGTIGDGAGTEYWTYFRDTTGSTIENIELATPSNHVARIEVDETETSSGENGHYGGIYHDLDLPASANPPVHELYYFTFEVKTRCGWRSKQHPNGFQVPNGGLDKFGFHNVSGWVEWHDSEPTHGQLNRRPHESITSLLCWNRFDAYGTSQNMDDDDLTRFCGRTYRPINATWARIVLIVDGHMPLDGDPAQFSSEVYFDNIYFFKAPPVQPVEGKADDDPLFSDNPVELVEYLSAPPEELDLSMEATINVYSDYLKVTGRLTNLQSGSRAIDLGFAIPVLDDPLDQKLEWHYDIRNSIILSQSTSFDKTFPFTFPGPIDELPQCSGSAEIPGSRFDQYHNLQVSAYPISSLGIDVGAYTYGLAFGDSLENDNHLHDPYHPSISHYGYCIDQPAGPFIGHYFVEFNLGLLGSGSAPENGTNFSFIIFRSDDSDFAEESSFREGLQKYQREIYPFSFQRPTLTTDPAWLLGGGFYPADPFDEGPNHTDPPDGFDGDPSDFGFRYTQALGLFEEFLEFGKDNGIGIQVYFRPWEGTFINDFNDPLFLESDNTYAALVEEKSTYGDDLSGDLRAIYNAKRDRAFKVPPGDQEIFAGSPYSFPTRLADTPAVPSSDTLVVEVRDAVEDLYNSYWNKYECFSGINLDNTLSAFGRSNHLDLCGNDQDEFVQNGGRLTYSFNHFLPAIPQLCTNIWIFPHLRESLGVAIDGSAPYGDNNRETNDEDEVILVNALEPQFGGSKYAIINADGGAFESNVSTQWNRSDQAFNFRRSVARDKSMARVLREVPCIKEVVDTLWSGGPGAPHFWKYEHNLYTQIAHEASWMALAWGFHPSIADLFAVAGLFPTDQDFDEMVDAYLRDPFLPGSTAPDVGYAELFRQLHIAGWNPVTNVVNTAVSDSGAPGDPSRLFIERFGPYEGLGVITRPVYITILNNDDLTLTLNDVVDINSACQLYIGDMETDQDVEHSKICDEKYGELIEYDESKLLPVQSQAVGKAKYFQLDIGNPDLLGLNNFNLHGMQLVEHESDPHAVNSPDIKSAEFDQFGTHYSVRLLGSLNRFVRIAGKTTLAGQEYGIIPDKALMVFKIWVDNKVDNKDGGEEERSSRGSSYYERFGNWVTMANESAFDGTVDVLSSAEPGASALFKMNIGRSGRYDVRVSYPDSDIGSSRARFEVFFIERHSGETGASETIDMEPVLTTMVNQSRRDTEAMDDEGFISIGEIEVDLGTGVDQVTVVVRVSSGGEESRQGTPTLVMADAVKFEEVGF